VKLRSLISETKLASAGAFYLKRFSEDGDVSMRVIRRIAKLEEKLSRPPPTRGKDSHVFESQVSKRILEMLSAVTPIPHQFIIDRMREEHKISIKRVSKLIYRLRDSGKIEMSREQNAVFWRLYANPAS
jgi:hypothetical protein